VNRDSFSADDLPVSGGRIFHLDLAPDELARDVIIVGDPDRVPVLADALLLSREADRCHRGFRTITGIARETGRRVSFVTSGIGASSTEIVLNELAALNEIDLTTRTRRERFAPLNVVRLGTSGGLHRETPLGALILTDYVVGLDSTALFYDIPAPDPVCTLLEERFRAALAAAEAPGVRFAGTLFPYAARSDRRLLAALSAEGNGSAVPVVRGVTVSSAGFFAEQGRGVARTGATVAGLLDALERVELPAGLVLQNMEMEAGFLLHFLGGLGYRGAALCAVINKRHEGVFAADCRETLVEGARVVLRAFRTLAVADGD
jgi:uridine phosphorylase